MAGWFFAARSSSSAWEVAGWLLLPRSGAVNGVQPSVGSKNASTRMLSLPFASVVAPARLPAFAVVSCAVCPVAGLSRYRVVTLSDWSWSTMSKLRTVGQVWPVPSLPPEATILPEVPADGTLSLPWRSSWNAVLKKLVPLQNDTWPNAVPALAVDAVALPKGVRRGAYLGEVRAVEPEVDRDHRIPRQGRHRRRDGRRRALGDDQRVIDIQLPGRRVQDRRLDERAQGARVGHRAAGLRRGHPVRAGELVRGRQALRRQRVRRDDDVAVDVGRRRRGGAVVAVGSGTGAAGCRRVARSPSGTVPPTSGWPAVAVAVAVLAGVAVAVRAAVGEAVPSGRRGRRRAA